MRTSELGFAMALVFVLSSCGAAATASAGEVGGGASLAAIDSLVVGKTTEDEFLDAGWNFEATARGRIGLLAVLWNDHLDGGHSVHSYFLGTCSSVTAAAAGQADEDLRRRRKNPDRPPEWDLRVCRDALLRYVQFHDGKLFKIEGPPRKGGDLDRFVVGVTTEEEFLKLGWGVDTARRFGLGVAGVVWELSAGSRLHTYLLDVGGSGYCKEVSAEQARGADGMIHFVFLNPDESAQSDSRVEKMFCPGVGAGGHYLRFRDGVLSEVDVPGR